MKSTEPTQPSVFRGDAEDALGAAHTKPGRPGDATAPFQPGDEQTELPTSEDGDADGPDGDGPDGDGETDSERDMKLLRAVAHAPPRRPRSAMAPGARWGEAGRYTIDRRLGRGGMGTVYAATDNVLKRVVALKILDAVDADQHAAHYAQLLREAQLAALVEHERIARVYDVGQHDGFAFVAMEYVPGGTLRQRITGREVPLPQVVDIATQIAEGLAELHSKGVIHRDLKPENVMLTAQGGIKLLDFGLARYTVVASESPGAPLRVATLDGVSVAAASGTPGYMAPEQYSGQPIDCRVDIFALGVILYELISRDRLFHGATVKAVMNATLEGAPVPSDGRWAPVPAQLRDDIARMLQREPEARFADGSRVLTALRTAAVELQASSRSELPSATASAPNLAPGPGPGSGKPGAQPRLPPVRPRLTARHVARASVVLAAAALGTLQVSRCVHPSSTGGATPSGMVRIAVGTIDVGRDAAEIDRECRELGQHCDRDMMMREVPRTRLAIPPFFLDVTEVTNQDFAELLNTFTGVVKVSEDEDDHYPRYVHFNRGTADPDDVLVDLHRRMSGIEYRSDRTFHVKPGRDRQPVALVSWYGAKLYCETRGKRLPSEDEWEAAARGRTDRRFPWGNAVPACDPGPDGRVAPWPACPELDAAPPRAVGSDSRDVTPDGIRDLGGSVSEWTSSSFVENNRASHPETGSRNAPRTIRGGSWGASLTTRTTWRNGLPPLIMAQNVGFRCASPAEDARR